VNPLIIEVPSPLGLQPGGAEAGPGALRKAGLHARLGSPDEARIDVPPYCAVRDPQTGVLNPQGVASLDLDLALVTGRGPQMLTDLDGLRPLVRDEDVALAGYRVLGHNDRIGEVESLAVLPPERGRGLGTLLLDCAEAVLDRLGAQDVMIGVLAGNNDALRFYERRGMAPAIVKLLRIGPKPAGKA
jgi:GNAT superfamily N-acetyltransferase